MILNATTPTETVLPRCPQCGNPIHTPCTYNIIQRDRRHPGGIRKNIYIFCSNTCGSNYQMSCEG
jgi:hypothetical protein